MELNAKTRTVFGKKVKRLREEGLIPAELFGRGLKNQHLAVSEKEFVKVYKNAGGNTVVYLVNEEGEKIPTLIAEVQIHPLSQKPLAVDFHQIKMDEAIEAKVPIEFTGTAPAEKIGLVVVRVLQEIEVKSLPGQIPHSFPVDISKLENAGDSIHVSDLKIPQGVKVALPPETVIATVTEKAEEETAAPPPAAEAPTAETAEAKTTTEAAKGEPISKSKEEKKQ